jgi:TetR/AcrR family transcriptional regulator, cholesterol catabolism regulator
MAEMEEKYLEILEGAKKIFTKYGIRCVSMDDISHELGISKKTLYHYFNNKAHLLEDILGQMNKDGAKMEENFRKQNMNAIDTILEVSKHLSVKMKVAHSIISFELKKYYPELYTKQLERTRNSTYINVKENLEHGIKDGLYRQDLDVELFASLYIKEIEGILDEDFYSPKQFSFSKIFETIFEKYIRGIANDKGIKYFEEKKQFYQF